MKDIELKAIVRGLQIVMTPDLIDDFNLLGGYQEKLGSHFPEITAEQIQYGSEKMKISEMRKVFKDMEDPSSKRAIEFFSSLVNVTQNPKGVIYLLEIDILLSFWKVNPTNHIDMMQQQEERMF